MHELDSSASVCQRSGSMRSVRSDTPWALHAPIACRLAAVVIVALAAVATPAGGIGRAAQPADLDPRLLMLRVPDLAPGYVVGDDTSCGVALVGEEGTAQALTDLTARYRYRGCVTAFERRWAPLRSPPGPGLVNSDVVVFDGADGAHAALGLGTDVVGLLAGVGPGSLVRVGAPETIGEETAVYRTDDALVAGRSGRPGTAVLWRRGRVLALIFVGGLAWDAGLREALRLAAVQQGRIASPTPLKPGDYDDTEVALDNPRLGIDVYWLGRRFAPGRGLRPTALRLADGPLDRARGPGWRAELEYGRSSADGSDVTLGLWSPHAWARFAKTRLGRLVWHERCARAQRLTLPGGSAILYAGFATVQAHCDRRRTPDRFLAHVYLRHLVVSVNVPIGLCCRAASGPYNSLTGMRRVVRALRRRKTSSRTR
jgi:hypothetical protein